MKILDGKAERAFRSAVREAAESARQRTDALWARTLDGGEWDAARERVQRAQAAFERELGGEAEPLALDAMERAS